MTDSLNNAAPAGWYVDPMTRQHLRWWNGQAWTESVAPLPGAAPAQPVAPAPAPRVQQRFALGAADEQTQAAATQTQVAAERFAPAQADTQTAAAQAASAQAAAAAASATPQAFVTQVPAYAARTEPAVAAPTGHYMPQYGDALDLLKGTSLVSGSGGADAAPAYRRGSGIGTGPIATGTDPQAEALAQAQAEAQAAAHAAAEAAAAAATQQRQHPPHSEVHADLAFASPQQQEQAAREAEDAHRAELARQEAARLEWDRQFQAQQAMAEELRLQQLAQAAQATTAAPTLQSDAAATASAADELESTLMSRRQRREQSEASAPAPAPAPAAFAPRDDDEKDIWAGPDDRRTGANPTWSTVGSARAAGRDRMAPRRWGTVSVWLLTITPWLGGLAAFVALALFPAWSLPAIGVLALPWLIGVLWAQQDSTRLKDLGHERPARAAWAMLTAPVYLIVRTVRVRREVGAGWPPLLVWCINAAVVAGVIAAVGLMPGALPAYVVEALDPLRETAAAWLGR
jgi:hypothetical protein